jgi:hypothetical protein
MKVFRPILGVITAIVLVPLGFGFIWFGNGELTLDRTAGILLTVVGIALLLIVVQTGHVSSFGLIVAGLAVTVFGAAALLSPPVASSAVAFFRSLSPQLAKSSEQWIVFAFVFAIGFVLLGAAVATWFAHRPTERSSSPTLRGGISVVLALAGTLLGFGFITRTDQNIVMLGALILGITVVSAMISSVGLFVSGALALVVGILSFIFHSLDVAIAHSAAVGGNGMGVGADAALHLGFMAAVGAIFLATAVVTRAAHARALRRSIV